MKDKVNKNQVDLTVKLGSVELANPVMTASGTCGYAFELADFIDMGDLGGFVTKSITEHPRRGNPPQRTFETAAGMLNSIGLANVGLEQFCAEKLGLLKKMPVPVFVNVAGKTIEEYVTVVRRLSEESAIRGLELNISCPNVKEGGLTFGVEPVMTAGLVSAVRKVCPNSLLIVKLTPNVTDISLIARAAVESGADVLSMINTFTGMAVDIETRKPVLGNRTGGLSGPAIKPIALFLLDKVYREVAKPAGIPIIGMGGICIAQDALEFIITGASAVAVGTAVLTDLACLKRIVVGIEQYLLRHKIKTIKELVGTLET